MLTLKVTQQHVSEFLNQKAGFVPLNSSRPIRRPDCTDVIKNMADTDSSTHDLSRSRYLDQSEAELKIQDGGTHRKKTRWHPEG